MAPIWSMCRGYYKFIVIICVERAKAVSSGRVVCRGILRRLLAADESLPVRRSVASSALSV